MIINRNTKLYELYKYLKNCNDYCDKKEMLDFFKYNNKYIPFNDELLYDILKIIIDYNLEFSSYDSAIYIYNSIVTDKNNKEQIELFKKFFIDYVTNKNSYNDEFIYLYSLFENKTLLLNILKKIQNNNIQVNYIMLDKIYNYIFTSRRFYIDEVAHYSSVISLIDQVLKNIHNKEKIDEIIDEQLDSDKQLAGLYDFDFSKINDYEEELKEIEYDEEQIYSKLEQINSLIDSFYKNVDKNIEDRKNISKKALIELKEYSLQIHQKENAIKIEEKQNNEKLDTLIEELKKFNENNSKCKSNKSNSLEIDKEDIFPSIDKIRKEDPNLIEQTTSDIIFNIKMYINNESPMKIGSGKTEIDKKLSSRISKILLLDKGKIFLSDNDYEFFKFYYYALYNNTIDMFNNLYGRTLNNKNLYVLLQKDVVEKFDKDLYLSIIRQNGNLLINFYNYNQIDLLSNILIINPNFYTEVRVDKIKRVIDIFGIDIVTKWNDEFNENIDNLNFYDIKDYKKIYDINPNFRVERIDEYTIFSYFNEIESIFTLEEIAKFSLIKQRNVWKLFDRYTIEYITKNKDIIRKIIISEDININVDDCLAAFRLSKLSTEQYLMLTQEEIIDLINNIEYKSKLHSYVGVKKFNKVLSKIKKDLKNRV